MITRAKRFATTTVALRPEEKSRLRAAQAYPDEPYWKIVRGLLDRDDARPKPEPEAKAFRVRMVATTPPGRAAGLGEEASAS